MNIDVVCGMTVGEAEESAKSNYLGKTYYFCSEECQQKFNQQPELFIVRTGTGASGTYNVSEEN